MINPFSVLTPRQCEIVRALVGAKRGKEIARDLGLSINGLAWHAETIHARLGTTSRVDLAYRIGRYDAARDRQATINPFDGLTPRQRTVMRAITEGKQNKEIAYGFCIVDAGVAYYLNAIHARLGTRTRAQIAYLVGRYDEEQGDAQNERYT